MSDSVKFGALYANSADGEYNEELVKVQSMLMRVNTCIPVIIDSVRNTGVSPVGYVNCRVAVLQTTGDGETVENAMLSNVPYVRIQGGTNALIIDPQRGDIGLVCFAQRDISGVKNARQSSPPGSRRSHSLSDGVYIGGLLNKTPVQYIHMNDGGIDIVSPSSVNITAPTTNINSATINLNGNTTTSGNAVIEGNFEVNGQTEMGGVGFGEHVHDETGTVTLGPKNP